jgi:hypothetical protein
MQTKWVLGAVGVVLFVSGTLLAFLPQETAAALGIVPVGPVTLVLQALSAALLGWGILNWFSRANLIGGIYGRPLALGNFLFFFVSASALGKAAMRGSAPMLVVGAAGVSVLFTVAFAWLLFFHDPVGKQAKEGV